MVGLFVGDKELMESHLRVGWIISNCAMLEGELAYLDWQLVAFDWNVRNPTPTDSERQAALNAERAKKRWSKNTPLTERIEETTKAFDARSIKALVPQKPGLDTLRGQWSSIADRTRPLAQKRNDLCHSSLYWRAGKLEREYGKLWGSFFETSEAEEKALLKQFGDLSTEVGELTTELGFLLPFADNNLRISATTS